MKLGEALIAAGIIDPERLARALDAQLIYGGTLGTCLIELGYVREDELGDVLSKSFGVPYASGDMLGEVPRGVTSAVPSNLVEKHAAIPFRRQRRVLDVAFADPSDIAGIDEIAFATGLQIRPHVAPEVRIFEALERHYGIPRRLRYLTLSQRLLTGRSAEWRIEAAPDARSEAETDLRADAPAGDLGANEQPDYRLSEASKRICRADSPGELADAVLAYASVELDHAILFRIEGREARIWRSHGLDTGRRLAGLSFPIVSEPVFGLLKGHGHYAGPVPDGPPYALFFDALGFPVPSEILLVPLHQNDRLVAVFYGSRTRGGLPPDCAAFRRLMQKAALGLDMLWVQRKIRVA